MDEVRIESREDVSTYLARLKYALESGAHISFQRIRRVDDNRDIRFTNDYTMNELFPDEDPQKVLRRELMSLTVGDYLRTVKDRRFPNKSGFGQHTTFVMSFHFAETPFSEEYFPYRS